MKRLVIDEDNWLEVADTDTVTVNGNPIVASALNFDSIGGVVSNASSANLTKGNNGNGRITNVATFED